jgi:hypothetical protein
MKEQRRRFGFREDAIDWIRENDFYYVDYFGWCHAEGFVAIVEHAASGPGRWALCVYKSAVPNPQKKED